MWPLWPILCCKTLKGTYNAPTPLLLQPPAAENCGNFMQFFFTKICLFSSTSGPISFFSGWYPKGISLYRTKYSSFPIAQFHLPGFRTPYRKDVSGKSEALLVYVNSNIPPKGLKARDYSGDIQVIYVEINLKKQKWLVEAIYIPLSQCKYYFINELKIWEKYRGSYENTVILGNFNMQPTILETLLEDNSFVNLITSNACFKWKPGSRIDLILTNRRKSFRNKSYGDWHMITLTTMLLSSHM